MRGGRVGAMPLDRVPGESASQLDRLVEVPGALVNLRRDGHGRERRVVVGAEEFMKCRDRLLERLRRPQRLVRGRPGVHVEQEPGPLRGVECRLDPPLGRMVAMLHEQRAAVTGGVGMPRLGEQRPMQLHGLRQQCRRLLPLLGLDEDVGRKFVDRKQLRRRLACRLLHLTGRDPQHVERLVVFAFGP